MEKNNWITYKKGNRHRGEKVLNSLELSFFDKKESAIIILQKLQTDAMIETVREVYNEAQMIQQKRNI